MDEIKLVVAWMVENDRDVFPLSYKSVEDVADAFVLVNGNKDFVKYLPEGVGVEVHVPFEHDNVGADGKQRGEYLKVVQEKYPDHWCLVLDADEFVQNPEGIKATIREAINNNCDAVSPFMRHYIGNLSLEDATQEKHYVPLRLFKVKPNLSYPEIEHSTLQGCSNNLQGSLFLVWHLSYAREIMRVKEKYEKHSLKSKTHSADYLTRWYHAHLFGEYPVKKVPFEQQPKILLEFLGVNEDYMYFKDRQLEHKHWIDASYWKNHFKPSTALEVGCGLGHRVFCMNQVGIKTVGFDISEWAVKNNRYGLPLTVGDVAKKDSYKGEPVDLVVAYDVLEHVEEKDLSTVISNLKGWSKKYILASIPFEGDPNLYNDPTHKIFKPREWWIEQFAKQGIASRPIPEYFPYAHQLLIMEVL